VSPLNAANRGIAHRLGQVLQVRAPLASHWRVATCRDVESAEGVEGCDAYRNGWMNVLPTASPAAEWIRARKRTRTNPGGFLYEEQVLTAGQSVFKFEPGQPCFKGRAGQHGVVQNGRPGELVVGRPGDSGRELRLIGNTEQPSATREFTERLGEGVEAIVRMRERGMVEEVKEASDG